MRVYTKLVMIMKFTSKICHIQKSDHQKYNVLHRNIHKFNSTCPDGKTHNQIDRILIHKRWRSSVGDVQLFRAADCDTDHYLVVAKFRERLIMSKQTMHRFHMERFNLQKLNEVEGKEQYLVEISNTFAALENLIAEVDINRAWETMRENINISAKGNLD
jgi:hypothetical protein